MAVATVEAGYWDEIADSWVEASSPALWRLHSDAVNRRLIEAWLPSNDSGRALKTDLFDEAVADGLYPLLAGRAKAVAGIDVSPSIVHAARRRYPALEAACTDVRELPFGDREFDVVVSLSTLDHFETLDEVTVGIREIGRVLRPGGTLLLTLDNRANPLVALRNTLPFGVLNRLGLVPYYVGATCGPRRLREILEGAGFDVRVTHAILHCPRVLAVAVAGALQRHTGARAQARFLRLLLPFERMGRWPTRFLTGHFVAVKAVKR
jgi:SAM-dependent methyltransferase